MTSTLRCISLLGCLLSVACSERTPAASTPDAREENAPAPIKPPPQEPALTATLPAKPESIVDAPKPALPTLPDAPEPAHDEPSDLPQVDYDRPLAASEVVVDRFVLASDVVKREPVAESDVFSTDTDKIFAFVQLANAKEPYSVKVHWEPADGPASPYGVALTVPTAPRHRTWAWTRIKRAPGRYHAVLRTLAGEEVARREFVVAEASD